MKKFFKLLRLWLGYIIIWGFGINVGMAMIKNDYKIAIGWGLLALLWSLYYTICEVH